jgi:hypothetical protein
MKHIVMGFLMTAGVDFAFTAPKLPIKLSKSTGRSRTYMTTSDLFNEIIPEESFLKRVDLNISFNEPQGILDESTETVALMETESIYNDYEDPYADLLDFKKPIASEDSAMIQSVSTIVPAEPVLPVASYANLVGGRSPTGLKSNYKRWEHWDDFMEAELGDIDAEITKDSDRWILEMRDLIEQKRGA